MMTITPILPSDNEAIANVIRTVLLEYDVPKVGTAYADVSLDCMFETYSPSRSVYYLVKKNGIVFGGAGIAPLENADESICELQKMYFLPEARGLGLGKQMLRKCLEKAQEFGYEKCYLETMPYMEPAQKLYQTFGFTYLERPMGNTGHCSCPVWMIKDLK